MQHSPGFITYRQNSISATADPGALPQPSGRKKAGHGMHDRLISKTTWLSFSRYIAAAA